MGGRRGVWSEEESSKINMIISMKTECDYLCGLIQKWPHAQKCHQKMVNPRDIAENGGEEEA